MHQPQLVLELNQIVGQPVGAWRVGELFGVRKKFIHLVSELWVKNSIIYITFELNSQIHKFNTNNY